VKILAIDTATEACSAALLIDGRLIAREMEFDRGHAEHILSMVDAVLAEGGTALRGVDAIAFGRGPGGFTGVRLAASVTQGLAFAAGLPVVPISDLAAVAQRALDLDASVGRVVVCNDARMKEVYWGCFQRSGEGFAAAVGVERVGAPETVDIGPHWRTSASATSSAGSPVDIEGSVLGARAALIGAAGRGFRAYPELRSRLLADPSVRLISDDILPRAHEIARMAVIEVQAGRLRPPEEAIPVYLRDDVARPTPS
jgi:tRNA threonylcarbamoyladenosine biosynthesis protein TsaB